MSTRNLMAFKITKSGADVPGFPVSVVVSFINGSQISRRFSSLKAAWTWLRRFDLQSIVTAEVSGGKMSKSKIKITRQLPVGCDHKTDMVAIVNKKLWGES